MDYEFVMKQYAQRPKVDQEYDFNDRIGRGSYGQVYKAIQKSKSQNKSPKKIQYFALKEIEMSSYSSSTCRELALYRELNHRNVMNLLSVFLSYSKQKAWLLFDYAEYDLHTILKFYRSEPNMDERVPDEMQKSCLFQTLNGLKYLHDNWILHRDLKPENILVMGDGPSRGIIKITDMGLARTFHAPLKPLADVDAVVCTCWYRAPELLLGSRHYTKAVDIFSFGCIMSEIMTNNPIFPSTIEGQPRGSPYVRGQLEQIFKVLGYPSVSCWPDVRLLPEYDRMQNDLKKNSFIGCTLAKYMKKNGIDPRMSSFDLLSRVLALDPEKRMSLNNALMHPYFSTEPLPSTDVFNCFSNIPFPNRKFLAPVNQVNVNVNHRINANFLEQINVKPNFICPKSVPSNAKYQGITRVTHRAYLQERNY